ncbi:hypothetical protein Raf01_71910 [Rugosimonospora africana]|uniref:Uncharacterized protein n=1 Tax=Rugosimonospora africana TaxID=556532 RepID=A0A8J3QZD0_9ACTN|nr:hypothetical protein Raf01_71910 [Rugosimonospora africana]
MRQLIARTDDVGRVSEREPRRNLIVWLTRGRWRFRRGRPVVPTLDNPWQDTTCPERAGWRTRAANLRRFEDEFVLAVDYQTCADCRIGWVEQPYTLPRYQRHGLARAGLAALRSEHPGLSWYTLGGHFPDSERFWTVVGTGVPGGYQQGKTCGHVGPG